MTTVDKCLIQIGTLLFYIKMNMLLVDMLQVKVIQVLQREKDNTKGGKCPWEMQERYGQIQTVQYCSSQYINIFRCFKNIVRNTTFGHMKITILLLNRIP